MYFINLYTQGSQKMYEDNDCDNKLDKKKGWFYNKL